MWYIHCVDCVYTSAKFCEVLKELDCRHLRIEGVGIFEFLVSRLIHHHHDERATGIVGCFVQLPVVLLRFMFSLGAIDLHTCGIFVDVVIVKWDDRGNSISPLLVYLFMMFGR